MKIKPLPEMEANGVKGIFVWGCIDRGEGSSFRARAHAHSGKRDSDTFGWICFRSTKRIKDCFLPCSDPQWDAELVKTNRILMHEYCHVLTPGHSHDDAWRKKMQELGQPIPARYKKVKRIRRVK